MSVVGFRAWLASAQQPRLFSIGKVGAWEPGLNRAQCCAGRLHVSGARHSSRLSYGFSHERPRLSGDVHPAPAEGCECGFWAFKRPVYAPAGQVAGAIACSGKIIEHDLGFRAELAEIVALVAPRRHKPELEQVAYAYCVPLVTERECERIALSRGDLLDIEDEEQDGKHRQGTAYVHRETIKDTYGTPENNSASQADESSSYAAGEDSRQVTRRTRAQWVQEADLGPDSLCGSWFFRDDHAGVIEHGLVVCEPQPGVYLLEFCPWLEGLPHQRLVSLAQMAGSDEEWRFYDSHRALLECEAGAYREMMKA